MAIDNKPIFAYSDGRFLILIKIEGGGKMKEDTRKCPNCGEDMNLVGYIDKDSKEDAGIEPTENFRMPGGFLSGSLRKYRCPNGHEATNEEPKMSVEMVNCCLTEPTGMKEPFKEPFEDAEILVGYMESHAETPRALVLFKHLVWLEYVAGQNISGLNRKSLEERRFISLHQCPGVVTDARERLNKGLVPKNWFEMFNKQIDEQSKF